MPSLRCECGQLLTYRPEQSGDRVRCPRCRREFHLPANDVPPADAGILRTSSPEERLMPTGETPPAPPRPKFELRDSPLDAPAYQPVEPPPPSAPPEALAAERSFRRRPAASVPTLDPTLSLGRAFVEAARHPLTRDGSSILLAGIIFFAAVGLFAAVASFFPIIGGLVAALADLAVKGYIFCYLMLVVAWGARGRVEIPDWPDTSDLHGGILRPLCLAAAAGLIAFGPLLLYDAWAQSPLPVLRWLLKGWGLFYFIMAILCVAVRDDQTALNPLHVLRAIAHVPREYAAVWALTVAALGVHWGIERLVGRVLLIGYILPMGVGLYLAFVAARATGLLYFIRRDRLKWLEGETSERA